MPYPGFGYSNYQYPAEDNQDRNPYSRGHAQPPSGIANPSLQHTGSGDYQQYGWQGQDLPGIQTVSQRNNNYWMNDSHQQSQSQPAQQQQWTPDTTGYQSVSGLTRNQRFKPQSSRGSVSGTSRHNDIAVNNNHPAPQPQANNNFYYQNNRQDMPAATAANLALDYQSNQNPMAIEPSRSPPLSERARDAASTMTALSTSLPSRSPQNYQKQQHQQRQQNSSPAYMTNPSSQVSTAPSRPESIGAAPQKPSPQMRQNRSPNMAAMGRETVNTVIQQPQHQQQHSPRSQSPLVNPSRQSKQLPDPVPARRQTSSNTAHADLYAGGGQSSSNPATQPTQSTMSLPNFVDPSQIFNPYQQEMEAARLRQLQQEREAKARKKQEVEEEAARRREDETRRQQEEQVKAEAEMRRHLEAMEQQSNSHNRSRHTIGHHVPGSAAREAETEESTPNLVPAPGSEPQKKKRQPKGQKNAAKSTDQNATSAQQAPRKIKAPKRKSEPATAQPSQDTDAPSASEDDDDENDMAREMKEMMKKMRKWKSKDPTLFTSLLADLKSAAPKEEKSDAAGASQQPTDLNGAGSHRKKSASRVSGRNTNKEVYTSEEPDLGKFPAARRRRQPKAKPQANQTQTSTPGQPQAAAIDNALESSMNNDATMDDSTLAPEAPEASVDQPPTESSEGQQPAQYQQISKATDKPADIWPSSKRHTLAEAACGYLNSLELNKSKGCTPSFIMELIEKNPSYIEICDMIESNDYHLNRVHFAKHLLKAVPDLISSSQPIQNATPGESPSLAAQPSQNSSQPPQPVQSSRPPPSKPLPPPPQLSHTRLEVPPSTQAFSNANTAPGHPDNPFNVQPQVQTVCGNTKFLRWQPGPSRGALPVRTDAPNNPASGFSQTTPVAFIPPPRHGSKLDPKLRVPAPPSHQPAPGTKEAMARKRNFSDIVDLTQSPSDEEGNMPPNKGPCIETGAPSQEQAASQPQAEAGPQSQPPKPVDLSKYKLHPTTGQQEILRRRNDLVKRFNKAEAPRKTYYNPKTIARDILIASGRHPTERPLNQHLSKLKEKFHCVDNNADLRTFRWDIVDPGGPSPPDVEPEPLPQPPTPQNKPSGLHNQQPRDEPDAEPETQCSAPRSNFKPSSLRISQTLDDNQPSQSKSPMINTSSVNAPSTPPARRGPGRPPGSKNKSSSLNGARAQKVEVVVPPSSGRHGSSGHGIYECRWAYCDAKLHNLDVLRKHIERVHLPEATFCQWPGCGEGSGSRRTYTTGGLREHVESHLSDVAWHKGEGPNLRRSGRSYLSDLDTCLNDDSGRALIPRANVRGAPPTLILPAAYSSIRSFNKLRGNESDKAKAHEVVRALENKQAQVGVGVGKGGCTLMYATRLSTVAAFEDVFEIVPAED